MADLAAYGVRLRRRPSLLAVFLALSLALNLCMIGGFAYSRWISPPRPHPTPERRLEMLAERLNLRPDQMQPYDEFRRALRHEQETLAFEQRPLMAESWVELQKDHPDAIKVQSLLDQMQLHRHSFQIDSAALIIRFMAVLTPEQRRIIAQTVLDTQDPAGAAIRSHVD